MLKGRVISSFKLYGGIIVEILSPAGNIKTFYAAILNGADAVYLGGTRFSARQYANNFTKHEIVEAVEYAHLRDKKVYITVNTLIDNNEMLEVLDYVFELQEIGVDAVIVQDIGLMSLIKSIFPDLAIHASTQMTIHNSEGVEYLNNFGIKRVVLARELSFKEIQKIKNENKNMEIEVFVHGALCYSYSGQCLFSSIAGGRSGNRGKCAQPCRLPFELFKDNNKQDVKGKHLLSPSDLCLIDYIPELFKAGVDSIKIEGRMKRPEYTAIVTRAYRKAIDLYLSKEDFYINDDTRKELIQIFNRNFTSGYFIKDNNFLSIDRPDNRGLHIGKVIEQLSNNDTKIKLKDELQIGDGIEIRSKDKSIVSQIVKSININNKKVVKANQGDIITIKFKEKLLKGYDVFKTYDERLITEITQTFEKPELNKVIVNCDVYLYSGYPLRLVFSNSKGITAEVETKSCVEKAANHPLTEEVLFEKLNRMGNTPFKLGELKIYGEKNVTISFSEINQARRAALDILYKNHIQWNRPASISRLKFQEEKSKIHIDNTTDYFNYTPQLSVTVSNEEQLKAAVEAGAEYIYITLDGLKSKEKYSTEEIIYLKTYCDNNNVRLYPILPRIQKPNVYGQNIINAGFKDVVVGNLGALQWALKNKLSIIVDYNFNVFNNYTVNKLLKLGVNTICLSPELNFKQLQDFSNMQKLELIVHGEIIIMQSEYCILGDVLDGNCNNLCSKNNYKLKDKKGYYFPIETDNECKMYIFNSRTLDLIEDLNKIIKLKPKLLRLEMRRKEPDKIINIIRIYKDAIENILNLKKVDTKDYKQIIQNNTNSDLTKCHYFRGVLDYE